MPILRSESDDSKMLRPEKDLGTDGHIACPLDSTAVQSFTWVHIEHRVATTPWVESGGVSVAIGEVHANLGSIVRAPAPVI